MSDEELRILYSFPHPLGGPGINHTAWEQVANLSALGVSVTVYCTTLREPLPPSVAVIETMRLAGRRVPHRVVGVRNAKAYHDARVAAALRRSPEEFDLVHTWPGACLRTIKAARRLRIPVFREAPNAHTASTFAEAARASAETGVTLPRGSSHRFDARRMRLEIAEFASADFILVPSDYVAESFLACGVDARRLVRHQYGYDPERFPRPSDERPPHPFTAVFVGRVEPAKGLHLALRAWLDAGCDNHGRFLIVGRGMPKYEEFLSPLLNRRGVERFGFISDVGAVLRSADVLLLPTYTEGSALVTIEAMASGVVPLVSIAAGAPITSGHEGFVHEVGDVAGLATQLRSLDGNPDLLAAMRKQALDRSEALTWHRAAERLLAGYRDALARTVGQTEKPG